MNLRSLPRALPWPFAWLALLFTAMFSGCTGQLLPAPTPPPSVYLLEIPKGPAVAADPSGPTLAIGAMRSAAGFDSADMVYHEHSYQLQSFAHHRWADAPARMLEPVLVASAERSGLFAGVIAPGSHARADLRLNAELVRLQQIFDADGSHVELTVRAYVTDSNSGRLLNSGVFDIAEAAPEATPYGGVEAANRATAQLAEQLQPFLASALAHYRSANASQRSHGSR